MRVLKYAILGLLYRQEYSGYDITSQFKREIGQFWSAKHSQIYPELRKLVDEGLIEFRTQIQGEKLEKKMYTITDHGRQQLLAWAAQPESLPETEKDEFMLKMYFIHTLSLEQARALFTDQLRQRRAKLADLQQRYEQLMPIFMAHKRQNADSDATNGRKDSEAESLSFNDPQLGHYLVLTKALAREQSYVDWLERHLKLFV
ncbi:PadR family transcriptional regulator [Paenibacillus campi]|uniref:PadR family transcriptional regulator n=1 Tax=Paenibacillus campi TaxID=3106031 RepID=UPI002AFE5490|nr:PadR family transcriptional regulator [Paenibacillus sp. SGZ-1014]